MAEHVLAIQRELDFNTEGAKREQIAKARAEQLDEGRCTVVPLPRVPTRPFRTELTIEQNSLFVANNFQGESFVREARAKDPATGEEVLRRMTVGKLHATDRARGVLKQIHQDVFYKVLELWGQQGYPVGKVRGRAYGTLRVSAYKLVDDNARAYRRTRELLRDLAAIPIVLENVYTWQGLKDREEFSLLAEVAWSEKELDEEGMPATGRNRSFVTIMLSSLVTDGFLARHIKVLWDSRTSRSGRAAAAARLRAFCIRFSTRSLRPRRPTT